MNYPKSMLRIRTAAMLAFVLLAATFILYNNLRTGTASAQDTATATAQDTVIEQAQDTTAVKAVQDVPVAMGSLKTVAVPQPRNLAKFIANREAAIALGKALFWDIQVGSDGAQSCASCHFHAGADNRSYNTLNPGTPGGDVTFQLGGPNYQLATGDFPFRKLSDINNQNSLVLSDVNEVVGSQGEKSATFNGIKAGSAVDVTTPKADPVFQVAGVNTRQVTGRNSPSVINAVFNYRNFWDGRAQNEFNGVNPFGNRDPNAYVLWVNATGQMERVQLRASSDPSHDFELENSSLASQAVGPPNNSVEMAADGRTFPLLGRKLLALKALGKQLVAADDSVLGTGSIFQTSAQNYSTLIQKAFKSEWWRSGQYVLMNDDGSTTVMPATATTDSLTAAKRFTQMESNFALFFGIAIQMYESTLVANDSPFDQYMDGNKAALTAQEQQGMAIFNWQGRCSQCHVGPEFTAASISNVRNNFIERMLMGNAKPAVYDTGFYNIGVRPTAEDIGVGGNDPFGNPLSFTRLFQLQNNPFVIPARPEEGIVAGPISPKERVAVDGAFKAPHLRNVELNAPYYHNGAFLSLRDVVDFYNRGGNFADVNRDNLDADITPLGLTDVQKDALVAFLKSLTDKRVRFDKAPFDHPQLTLPNGATLNAVGRNGYPTALKNFLEQ